MNNCSICNCNLSQERIEALQFLGKLPQDFTCISCAEKCVNKVKGFYQGASGVSNLNIVRDLGQEERLSPIISYEEYEAAICQDEPEI